MKAIILNDKHLTQLDRRVLYAIIEEIKENDLILTVKTKRKEYTFELIDKETELKKMWAEVNKLQDFCNSIDLNKDSYFCLYANMKLIRLDINYIYNSSDNKLYKFTIKESDKSKVVVYINLQ